MNINGNRRNEMKLFHGPTSLSSQADESVAHLLSERHLRMCLILRYLNVNINLNVGNGSIFSLISTIGSLC